MMTDPIADFCTRLRQQSRKPSSLVRRNAASDAEKNALSIEGSHEAGVRSEGSRNPCAQGLRQRRRAVTEGSRRGAGSCSDGVA